MAMLLAIVADTQLLAVVADTQLLAAEAYHLQGNECQLRVCCLSLVTSSDQLSRAVSKQRAQAPKPLTCTMQDLR